MQCTLAVDIGASGGRHIVGWLENGVLQTKEVYRFENGMITRGGKLCWDMDTLLNNVLAGMKACREQGFLPTTMGIDTWAVDFVLLDGANKPVGDAVAYRDNRTQGMDALLEQRMPFSQLYAITGIAKQPFNTVYQMMAALHEHPEYRQQVRDFLLVPEYIAFMLTGEKRHEWTNASTTALMDAQTKAWSPDVRKAANLPAHWFETPVCQPGTPLGKLLPHVASAVGFDTQVLLTATHDTASAFVAVPAKDENAAFLSSGTWSLLGTELPSACTTQESCAAGFTNEGGYRGTTRYLKNIMGMWMLQSIRNETKQQYSFAQMAQMTAQSTYSAYVDATDNRFLAPDNMLAQVEAALREQGAPTPETLGDVLRAVTMGLAVCYRDAIAQMQRLTGKAFTTLHIVGGGSQNATLNALTAELTGLHVFSGPTEGTAIGNLLVQMLATGELPSLGAARELVANSFLIQEVK